MLMARLDKLSHDEMKTLLYRYFQKVIYNFIYLYTMSELLFFTHNPANFYLNITTIETNTFSTTEHHII